MEILLIDNHTSYIGKLDQLLRQEYGNSILNLDFGALGTIDANEFDLIILSGGTAFRPDQKDQYSEEIDIILATEVPIIGICLGAEIIAALFGAVIEELPEKQRAVVEILAIDSPSADAIFHDIPNLKVKESHQFTIPSVYSPLEPLAISDTGVEIFHHKALPIYGLQFHPESSIEGIGGRQILLNIIQSIQTK